MMAGIVERGTLLLSLFSVLQAYRWSPDPPADALVSVCAGDKASFPWFIVTGREGETVLDIDWFFQAPDSDNVSIATFTYNRFIDKTKSKRFSFLPNAGLSLRKATLSDSGRYYVVVNLYDAQYGFSSTQRAVTLVVSERGPASGDGGRICDAVHNDVTQGWTLHLTCGRFSDVGLWTPPSGEARNSSDEDSGTFVLSVSSPVQGGNYSCHLPPSTPAARCLTATSPLLQHQAMQISQLLQQSQSHNETVSELEQENQDQAMQISQLLQQSQSQNETVSELEQENQDQAMQISRQKETIQELRADLVNLTSQWSEMTQTVERLRLLSLSSCADWLVLDRQSGVRTVYVLGKPITVYCDQTTDGGGWIVFQRRVNASVDFYRDWEDYRNGFGDLEGNFWLGLDKLHSLTTSQRYKLRVDLHKWDGTQGHATYSGFYLDGVGQNFALRFDSFLGGNAGDSLRDQVGRQFSTRDRDHDAWSSHCAQRYHGAWWYNSCHSSNLNGDYKASSSAPDGDGLNWNAFGGTNTYSMKFTEMKIRPM